MEIAALTTVHRRPDAAAPVDTQFLHGEAVRVFDRRDGWAWVQGEADGYVGYIDADALRPRGPAPTHRVAILVTPLFPAPDIKAPTGRFLSLTAPVAAIGEKDRFVEIAGGGWVFADHMEPRDTRRPDLIGTARMMLGLPYLWGGKGHLGVDCSGLVQLALLRAGIAAPRDTDMQEESDVLGARLPRDSVPQRGDLIFWRGHVAIAMDATRVLHATAGPLKVVIEDLAEVDRRARADSPDGITSIVRPERP
jgi:cell wall-associated NlpC family hydrolase